MKLTAILLLSAAMTASAAGHAQRVTLALKDAPLKTVFLELNKQTGYNFLYTDEALAQAKKVTIQVKDAPLSDVLSLCFKDQPLDYQVENNAIVIKAKLGGLSPAGGSGSEQRIANSEQPPIDIHGRITNENGEPVIATVIVKGTQQGATTNSDGYFELKNVDDNATLVISGVSIETREIKINGKSDLVIAATTKVTSMNEVVINKGYYTETQKLSVSNVGRVTAKDIEKQPINNPLYAIQGRVPGLQITQTSGLPGTGVIARIQGQNSLKNGSDPLYIIDGVPMSEEVPSPGLNYSPLANSGVTTLTAGITGTGNVLSFLNPYDIESIEILKDADATAIYGSRAANGAILITTKRGRAGKTAVNADFQQGWEKVGHFMDVLLTPDYLRMRHQAFSNDNLVPTTNPSSRAYAPDLLIWDTTRNTNWQKDLIGKTAKFTNASASISGGSSSIQYLVGANYHKETTVFPGDFEDERGAMHLSLGNNDPSQKFHFQTSGIYSFDDNQLPANDLTKIALQLAPNAPQLYNSDGTLNWAQSYGVSYFINPLAQHLYSRFRAKTSNLVGNTRLSYQILPGLIFSGNAGYTSLQQNNITVTSLLALKPEDRPNRKRVADYGNSKVNTWILEPQVNYKVSFGKSKLDALVGSTFQRSLSQSNYSGGAGYANDQLMQNPSAASIFSPLGDMLNIYKYNAIYARGNYIYADKYIVNMTARRDGSSRFGANNRFHNFWSVGAGWIFSDEKWFHNQSILSFGKLKGNYGTTGSDQIGDYQYLTLYNPFVYNYPYQATGGLSPVSLPNPYLQWEETKKITTGIDLGFLRDRIFASVTYSRNRSSNQLLRYDLPRITGRSTIIENFPATIQNTNWEFSLNTENIKKKSISWSTNINLTIPKNKLVAFSNLAQSSYSSNYIIGQSISIIKLFHFTGVDPTTGLYTVADINGTPTLTPNFSTDRRIIKSLFPKYYGGIQNEIQYKSFELSFLFQFVKQIAALPTFGFGFSPGQFVNSSSSGNQPLVVVGNNWQKAGDAGSSIQKFAVNNSAANNSLSNALTSDAAYGDASYARLKNLSLSWQMPPQWIQKVKLQSIRLYVQGQNLLTFTKYKGLDPETLNYQALPPLRVITVGVQVKL